MRKLVFNGWGSRELLEFLGSIGKDTAMQLSQQEVVDIITTYCVERNLFDPDKKKKRILCDAKLLTLFRRKSINKNVLNAHLSKHFADNHSDDESGLQGEFHQWFEVDDGNGEIDAVPGKRKRDSRSEPDCQTMEMGVTAERKPQFASVTAENIRRIYLRRKVLEELLEDPESSDTKVIGSFVRIKADPYDYSRRNSHMLVLVTGVRRPVENDKVTGSVLLQVSRLLKDVPISKVSDDKFTEEECEDLRQQVKDDLMQRPIYANFEEKARSLHEVITKDWIVRELALLKRLIDQANEKGWRRELSEYLERLSKLKMPEEQSRLLREIPEIIADEEEVEPDQGLQMPKPDELEESQQLETATTEKKVAGSEAEVSETCPHVPIACGSWSNLEENGQAESQTEKDESGLRFETKSSKAEFIDLSDDKDEDSVQQDRRAVVNNQAIDLDSKIWRCASTNGLILGGLYSISLLKQWKDTSSGPCVLQFKVWKEGQSQEDAIFLDDAIRRAYSSM